MKHRFFRATSQSQGRPRATPVTSAQAVGITVELGSLMAVGVVLGLVAGQWLDERLGTGLLFTLLGVVVGLACAGLGPQRQYRAAARQSAAELAAAKTPSQPAPEDQRTGLGAAAPSGQ